jgi:hypothetical protein
MSDSQQAPASTDHGQDAVAFVHQGAPLSSNRNLGTRGLGHRQRLVDLYVKAGGTWSAQHRYGVVYYFVRGWQPATDADVGNISKRI